MMPKQGALELEAEIKALMASIGRLCKSEMYSDLTIECRGSVFKVHRAIICTQSKPLAAMVNGNWREAATGKIDLEDDDPFTVAKMIDFLYRTRYNDDRGVGEEGIMIDQSSLIAAESLKVETPLRNTSVATSLPLDTTRGPLITNTKVYILGNKYDIPSLKEVATRKYKEAVKDRWDNDTFAESAAIVYKNIISDEDGLKDVIVEAARSNIC